MKRVVRWMPAAALVGLAALVAVLALRPASPKPKSPRVRFQSSPRAAYLDRAEPLATARPQVAPGRRIRYALSYRTAIDVHVQASVSRLVVETEGDLVVRDYEGGERPLQGVAYLARHLVATDAQGRPQPEYADLIPSLAAETLVRRDAPDRAPTLRFAEGLSPDARNFLRGLLALLELALPSTTSDRWVARGEDTTGRYVAEYAVVERSRTSVRVSRVRAYDELFILGGDPKDFAVQSDGHATIVIDAGVLASVDGRETLDVRGVGPLDLHIRSEALYRLEAKEIVADDAGVLAAVKDRLDDETRRARFDGFFPERAGEPQRLAVHGAAVTELINDLAAATAQGRWTEVGPRYFLMLREMMASGPDARERARETLRRSDLPPEVLQTVADAFASAPGGWKDLLEMADDPARRLVCLQALGLVRDAPDDVVRYLSNAARNAHDAAVFEAAVGSLGLNLGFADPSRADSIARELVSLLGRSPDRDALVLHALGNAPAADALPVLLDRANAPDDLLRATAVYALRSYPQPDAFNRIVQRASDPSESVRIEACAALAERSEPAVADTLERIARQDAHEGVRIEALQYFAARAATDPRARALLEWSARNDPSDSVRSFASTELTR